MSGPTDNTSVFHDGDTIGSLSFEIRRGVDPEQVEAERDALRLKVAELSEEIDRLRRELEAKPASP